MIILGIDPAITRTGWGVISASGSNLKYLGSGVIDTKSCDAMSVRLAIILSKTEDIIKSFKPDIAAIEETFVNKNALSSLKLSHARGAIMAVIGKYNIPLHEFAPNKIKKTLTGSGHAEKEQMMHMIKILMPTAKLQASDEADALAVAYTCLVYNVNN
jgi:crossover junction endodeoxyribonuclease RuvC